MFWSNKHFEFKDIPDLTGKTAIITGASAGIGKVCALEMARKGCKIIFACRNEEKTLPVMEEIRKETGNDKLEFIKIDLLSLQSVKKFIETVKERKEKVNILMNNSGIMFPAFALSEDGIESQFATNHLGHFYLTTELLPILEENAPSRIVNVSSLGHMGVYKSLGLENINDPKYYNRFYQYSKTKAANILFTRELAKRLEKKGVENVYVNCNHPGVVRSELTRHLFSTTSILTTVYNKAFTITTEDGALTQLYLATSPEVEDKKIKGKYYVPFAEESNPCSPSKSDKNAKELWEYSENILKEKIQGYEGLSI
ncbi:hypothetical protein BJ944DRAFT_205832 [Cunninghamella echinulata]|nr:hypothetical protein BJ944DRAFT_205832 [Cunninghamella echinulata]